MSKQVELHWYAFSFSGKIDGADGNASVYIGYARRGVTKPMIEEAKKAAGANRGAVLLGCSYLGFMTRGDFLGE